MRKASLTLLSLIAFAGIASSVWALCNPYQMWVCCEILECQQNTQTKSEIWTAYFENSIRRDVRVYGFAGVSSCQSPDC